MFRVLCLVSSAVVLSGCHRGFVVPSDAWVVRNATVVDGTGAAPIPDGVVVIQGERVLAVGPSSDFSIPSSVQVVDGRGGTVIPGVFNAHVHHGAPAALRRQFLLEGVTSVCDLGSRLEEMDAFREAEAHDGPAARGFRSGPIVTAPGGYPDGLQGSHINYEVADAGGAPAAIADLADRGADMIKLAVDPSWNAAAPLPTLGLETVRSVADEAHARGLPVRAHVIQPPHLELAIEAGVDVIEHLAMPRWPPPASEEALMASDDPVGRFFHEWATDYQRTIQRMADQRIAMVPTVSALAGGLYTAQDPTPRQQWVARVIMDIPRRLHDAGGIIAVGNDFNDRSVRERMPLLEMQMLREAGLSPMEVIVAATRNGALVCGQDAELGTLEPGKLADLLVLDGDPLADLVGAMEQVAVVVRSGVVVHVEGAR